MKYFKSLKIISLIIFALFSLTLTSQEKISYELTTKSQIVGSDSLHKLYCVFNIEELRDFRRVNLAYNKKIKRYPLKDLDRSKGDKVQIKDDKVYILIDEFLDNPHVIVEGIDAKGNKQNINYRNQLNQISDPRALRLKWEKDMTRVDSMDYLRQFENVFIGEDGQPRIKNKKNKVYLVYRDYIKRERK